MAASNVKIPGGRTVSRRPRGPLLPGSDRSAGTTAASGIGGRCYGSTDGGRWLSVLAGGRVAGESVHRDFEDDLRGSACHSTLLSHHGHPGEKRAKVHGA